MARPDKALLAWCFWVYRELLYFLTWRDVKVRYKQTSLGTAWAIIQAFFIMMVFSLFFGWLTKILVWVNRDGPRSIYHVG